MAARPRLQVLIATTAVFALAIPVSGACAATLATHSSARTTLFLAHTPGSTQGGLTATKPSGRHWTLSRTDTLQGWVEVRAGGAAKAVTVATPAAPDGHGWVWSGAGLAGDTVAAGTWRPTVSLKAIGSLTVVPRVRVYRLRKHSYTLITQSTGKAVRLTKAAKKITLPGVKVAALSFSAGDRLYVDVVAKVTKAGTSTGDGVQLLENAGAPGSLSLPALAGKVILGQRHPPPDPERHHHRAGHHRAPHQADAHPHADADPVGRSQADPQADDHRQAPADAHAEARPDHHDQASDGGTDDNHGTHHDGTHHDDRRSARDLGRGLAPQARHHVAVADHRHGRHVLRRGHV